MLIFNCIICIVNQVADRGYYRLYHH